MTSTNGSSKSFSIAIVGGGISGLSLGITLLDRNIPITIYEAAHHFTEIGAGLAYGPNAGRAMAMTSSKIFDAYMKCKGKNTFKGPDVMISTVVGDVRRADREGIVRKADGLKVGDEWFDIHYSGTGANGGVYRAHFLDELAKNIPDGIAQFHKRLVDLKDADDGSRDMVLHFEDGTSAQHSAVIGCDGIKSTTRKWLLGKDDPAATPVFSGRYACRGFVPMNEAIEILGEKIPKDIHMIFGYGGSIFINPIAQGQMMNAVAIKSCKTWEHEKWVIPATKEKLEADWAEWGPTIHRLTQAMQNPDIWGLFMHLPCSTFARGRVCLLGDAAHASTPHQGAGGGMGMEDCLILGGLMQEVNSMDDLESAFSAFDQVRRERTQKSVVTSEEAGRLYGFELIGDDLEKIEENFKNRMKWIWEIDLDEHLREAKRIFHEEQKRRT